jgi:LmbE family N-acetylglucosaminyl deacetylase
MNALAVAPHPDDESLGCGGALCLHAAVGARTTVVFLTSGELGLKHLEREEAWRIREQEARAAADILGVAGVRFLRGPDWQLLEAVETTAAALRPILEAEAPQVLYLPHPEESHPDHQAAARIVGLALQGRKPPTELFGYEVWTPLMIHDRVQDVTNVMARKLRAVRCHRSQLAGIRYDRAIRGLNQYRGALTARCRYAEVFRRLDLADLTVSGEAAGPRVS